MPYNSRKYLVSVPDFKIEKKPILSVNPCSAMESVLIEIKNQPDFYEGFYNLTHKCEVWDRENEIVYDFKFRFKKEF